MKTTAFAIAALLGAVLLCLPLCVNTDDGVKIPPVDNSNSTTDGMKSIVDANDRFAFDLYSKYETENGNVFFSPYSISSALAMTYEGAKGKTADEMQSVLHLPKDDNTRRSGFAGVISGINTGNKDYTLKTANALWAQKDYQFLKPYFDVTERYYGGKVTNLDFIQDTENSRTTINKWVEDQTNNKIKDLIPRGVVGPATRLVLTNAIYFKGTWVRQFDAKNTIPKEFTVSPGKTVQAEMMSMTGEESRFNYTETDKVQILELPYSGGDLSMLVLLPKDGDIGSLESSIDAGKLLSWTGSLRDEQVNVYLPKFKFETKYMMSGTLKELGMPTAFSGGADFSGMTGNKDLYISEVIHQAYVEVNEEGTEAAAATAVVMENAAIEPSKIKTFNADHQFIFLIVQKKSNNVLFMGRVSDPTK